MDHPDENYGLLIKPESCNFQTEEYTFRSSENLDTYSRPMLCVTYRMPAPTATPTPTSTASATPTGTATPTNTLTPTNTATGTNTPTPTETPTITSTPTTTATPTRSTGDIAGIAFNDFSGDGIRQAGEPPLVGAFITLRDPGGPIATSVTGMDGAFQFLNLVPGPYSVIMQPPPGFAATSPGAAALNVSAGSIWNLTFGAWFRPTETATPSMTVLLTGTPSIAESN